MHRIFLTCIEAAIAAVFLLPVFLYLHKNNFQSKRTTLATFTFTLYLCAVYAMVGLPNVTYVRFDAHCNLIPFRYMFSDYTTSLLNVLLFMPLGIFLPVLRGKFRSLWTTLLFGFCMSLFIEVFQIFTYRATDVNDLMTNTVGTVLGYLIGRTLLKIIPQLSISEEPKELRTLCTIALAVMFFPQPFLSRLVWNLIY